jgi:hypothetical protein
VLLSAATGKVTANVMKGTAKMTADAVQGTVAAVTATPKNIGQNLRRKSKANNFDYDQDDYANYIDDDGYHDYYED